MKILPHLAAVVAATKPAINNDVQRSETVECGGSFMGVTEARIKSPGFPELYSNDLQCVWVVQNECAASFTIKAHSFDLEGSTACGYDKLAFDVFGAEEQYNFCGYPSWSSASSSSSSSSSDIDNEITSNNGMNGVFEIFGNELNIQFQTDSSVVMGGFDIQITVKTDPNCVPVTSRPPAQCFNWPFGNDNPTAFYDTEPGFDVAVPFSDFSQSIQFEFPCFFECVGTAGCFKVYYDDEKNTCELRGNELTPVKDKTAAFNGKYCDGREDRVWIDGRTTTRLYCHFAVPESADSYLEYLNQKNPEMLEWVTEKRFNFEGPPRDQVSSSKIWTFSVAENRDSDTGVWYTFHSVTYFRKFLPEGARKRREAESSDALFQSLAEESAAQFVNDLDIGDTGATVLETEEPVIEVEILEEVAQPQDVEFAADFLAFEEFVYAAMDAIPWKPRVPMLAKTVERFSWFSDFSDAPCANYAGEGVGSGVDYVAAIIDAEDPCATIGSFYNALLGYYDDFVCLDRADENPFKKRMKTRVPHFLKRTKVIFNRFLKKLSCEERL
ncbi:unnamed protein product [Oikopleura dioica]|uniref:CUB domain-containing protein n=1 Tax=Oikopleura dioica TaxID=34765 RepID=E4Y4P8_OIKDI|nr:unnamed protein product [Oikopleura dioica]